MSLSDRDGWVSGALRLILAVATVSTSVCLARAGINSPICGEWTTLIPDSDPQVAHTPRPRDYGTLVYDSNRHRLILFGGRAGDFDYLNDVWSVDLTTQPLQWQRLATSGTSPIGRLAHRAVFDAANDRMIVVGGVT